MTKKEKKRFKELKRKYKKEALSSGEELELMNLCDKEKQSYNNAALRNRLIKYGIIIGILLQSLMVIIVKILASLIALLI